MVVSHRQIRYDELMGNRRVEERSMFDVSAPEGVIPGRKAGDVNPDTGLTRREEIYPTTAYSEYLAKLRKDGESTEKWLEHLRMLDLEKNGGGGMIPEMGDSGMAVLEGEEATEAFRKVADGAIELLVTHGILVKLEDGSLKLHCFSDLDGKACIYLCRLAGLNARVEFVSPGGERENALVMDTSQREGAGSIPKKRIFYIDHHGEDSPTGTSAAERVYDIFWRSGLIDLENVWEAYPLEAAINFVTAMDNAEYPEMFDIVNFQKSHRTLVGLSRFLPFEKVLKFFEDKRQMDPLEEVSKEDLEQWGEDDLGVTLVEKSEKRREQIESSLGMVRKSIKQGSVLKTEKGSIFVDIGSKIPLGREAAFALGMDTFVGWDPEENGFVVLSKESLGVKLGQGFIVREKMWLKPKDSEKLEMTLGELLKKLVGGEVRADGKLAKYLEIEAEERSEMGQEQNEATTVFLEQIRVENEQEGSGEAMAAFLEAIAADDEAVPKETPPIVNEEEPILEEPVLTGMPPVTELKGEPQPVKEEAPDEVWKLMQELRAELAKGEAVEKDNAARSDMERMVLDLRKAAEKKTTWERVKGWFRRTFG